MIDERVMVPSGDARLAVRVRGREGARPLLVLGPGPGLPLLPEAKRIERGLTLDGSWLTAYVDPRGCGASRGGAVAVDESIADVGVLARWLAARAGAPVTVLGMSIGASFAIAAAARDPAAVRAVVGLGADIDLAETDASAHAFLASAAAARGLRAVRAVAGIAATVLDARTFQRRARWLTELGGMQRDLQWGTLLRRTMAGLLRTYGPIGAIRALRAMARVQDAMLPPLSTFAMWSVRQVKVPITLVHGDADVLSPIASARRWLDALEAPATQMTIVRGGRHVPHEEAPELVRGVLRGLA